jgi:hypothetical protein
MRVHSGRLHFTDSLANIYKTRIEMNRSGKHSSLLRYGNNYSREMFYSTGPWLGRSNQRSINHLNSGLTNSR